MEILTEVILKAGRSAIELALFVLLPVMVVMLAIIVTVINLLVDIIYAFVDPRIKSQYKSMIRRAKKNV